MIHLNKTKRKPVNTDPRYKNGTFQGNRVQERIREAIRQQREFAARHPASHGWRPHHLHPETQVWVWELRGARMMYIDERDGWQVDVNGESYFYTGTMQQITDDVLEQLPVKMTDAEVVRRQAASDAANPDFDNGVQ